MAIYGCTEIRDNMGSVIQLFDDEKGNKCISIIDSGRMHTIELTFFELDELRMMQNHIQQQIDSIEEYIKK